MKIRSSDLYLIGALIASGATLVGTDYDGGRTEFEVDTPDDIPLAQLELDYYAGRLTVPAIAFKDSLNALREIIFSSTRRGGDRSVR